MCGLDVGSGPPTTTGLPCLWNSSMSRSVSICCVSMPPVITISAQAICSSVSSSVLRLTRRMFQCFGIIAATVMRPSGAVGYWAPTRLQALEKFQNE